MEMWYTHTIFKTGCFSIVWYKNNSRWGLERRYEAGRTEGISFGHLAIYWVQ